MPILLTDLTELLAKQRLSAIPPFESHRITLLKALVKENEALEVNTASLFAKILTIFNYGDFVAENKLEQSIWRYCLRSTFGPDFSARFNLFKGIVHISNKENFNDPAQLELAINFVVAPITKYLSQRTSNHPLSSVFESQGNTKKKDSEQKDFERPLATCTLP